MADTISYIKIGNQTHPIDAVTVNGITISQQEKNTWNSKQNALSFDSIPTENSNNLVKSGDLYTVIVDNEEVTAAALNDLNDRMINVENGMVTEEYDPVFSSSAAASITSANISNWNSKTSNTGTLTGISMNGVSKGTSGNINLGTVVTGITFNGSNVSVSKGVAAISVSIPAAVTSNTVAGWGFTKNSAPGTLTTTATTSLSTATNEALSGNISLHKIAKTGTYSDLVGKPDLPMAAYFNPANETMYFFKSTADRDSFVANRTQTSLVMFSTQMSPYIKFKDPNVLSVLLTKNIGDGVGITETQAAAVTSMNNVFDGNTGISTFDEGEYFTGSDSWASAFRNSTVTRVKLPMGLRTTNASGAWSYMFYGCTSLQEINFADMQRGTEAAQAAQFQWFTGCSTLTTISFDNIEQICKFVPTRYLLSDVPFGYNTNTHLVNLNGHELINVVIPSTITSIRPCTFYRFNRIVSVTNIASVTTIGQYAFYQCTSLTTVTEPTSLTTIEPYTFSQCTSLKSISLPVATTIGNCAFNQCTSLSCDLPLPVATTIGKYAFYQCPITNLSLPVIETIGEYAFSDCTEITSLTLPSTITTIGNGAFKGCSKLVNVTINNSVNCGRDCFVSSGTGEGTFTINGNYTETVGSSYNRLGYYKHYNITGDLSSWTTYWTFDSKFETIRIGGNIIGQNTTACVFRDSSYSQKLKFFELMGTSNINLCSAFPQSIESGFIAHFGYSDIAMTAAQAHISDSKFSKLYVGDGTSAAADQAVLNKYLADSTWSPYSSKLDLWYNYTGTYKTS